MDIGKWFHKLFNPHCPICREDEINERQRKLEDSVCNSCEVLKIQLEHMRIENQRLIAKITEKPEVAPVVPQQIPQSPVSRHIPWRVKQQILEQEDRARANAQRSAAQPDVTAKPLDDSTQAKVGSEELKEFENELANAAQAREQKSAS